MLALLLLNAPQVHAGTLSPPWTMQAAFTFPMGEPPPALSQGCGPLEGWSPVSGTKPRNRNHNVTLLTSSQSALPHHLNLKCRQIFVYWNVQKHSYFILLLSYVVLIGTIFYITWLKTEVSDLHFHGSKSWVHLYATIEDDINKSTGELVATTQQTKRRM